MEIGAIGVIAMLLAVGATILAYIFIVPEKRGKNLNGFGKFLHNMVNFKSLVVEKILQATYIFSTAMVILLGFFMLFYVEESYWGDDRWFGGQGILLMLLGPVAIRLVYELAMMLILLVKNVIQINNKLKDQTKDEPTESPFDLPDISEFRETPAQFEEVPAQPTGFCTKCGAMLTNGAFCTKCGAKVE